MRYLLSDLRIFSTLLIISIFILIFDNFHFLQIPKSILQTVTIPIQYGLYKFSSSTGRQAGFIFEVRHLAQENKAMQTQLAELLTENATLRTKLTETQAMLEQQKSLPPTTYNLTPARVIGLGRFLTIDKGAQDGVKVDMVVVYKDNFVGKVKSVNPKTSTLMLAFDPDSKIAVFSQNTDGKAKGILTGQFGSELLMDKILHEEPIKEGDLVYSEGTEGQLPRGLIMGKVDKVLDRQNEVFKQAQIKTVFNLSDLDVVFLMQDQ